MNLIDVQLCELFNLTLREEIALSRSYVKARSRLEHATLFVEEIKNQEYKIIRAALFVKKVLFTALSENKMMEYFIIFKTKLRILAKPTKKLGSLHAMQVHKHIKPIAKAA